MFSRIELWDFLSFGGRPNDVVELGQLNLLIGPNGSGKSNLLDAICVFRDALSEDWLNSMRARGDFASWRWRGSSTADRVALKLTLDREFSHEIYFDNENGAVRINYEEVAGPMGLEVKFTPPEALLVRERSPENVSRISKTVLLPDESILTQVRDPELYPAIEHIVRSYRSIRFYRTWEFGPNSRVRTPLRVEPSVRPLREDASNLPAVLLRLQADKDTRESLRTSLQLLIPDVTNIRIQERDGYYDWGLSFEHTKDIAGARLSDGTLRWLSILCVLLDPASTGLICIEEPELGLHPDMSQPVGDLIRRASQRCQLVVTTHSTALVSTFSDMPESILVVENIEGRTKVTRLSADNPSLRNWLEQEDLGLIWASGGIGGNRF
jgi:predicted ATPase